MGKSSIEWTDYTFNPWIGCTKVSQGCKNCYAERDFDHRRHFAKWGPSGTRVMTGDANWKKPIQWDRLSKHELKLWTIIKKDPGIRLTAIKEISNDPNVYDDSLRQMVKRRVISEHDGLFFYPLPWANYRVFCSSLADVFEDWNGPMSIGRLGEVLTKPASDRENHPKHWMAAWPEDMEKDPQGWRYVTMQDVRNQLFRLIDDTPNLDWLLLTKRPENIRGMIPEYSYNACSTGDCPHDRADECSVIFKRENVWLGTSIEDQQTASYRIPHLLSNGDLSRVLFLSAEPLLGPVDLRSVRTHEGHRDVLFCGPEGGWEYEGSPRNMIHWVIGGGESGHNARPCNPEWARSLRDQCESGGITFFWKQWGKHIPECQMVPGFTDAERQRMLDGREYQQFPSAAVNQFS
jgi:protein gp37